MYENKTGAAGIFYRKCGNGPVVILLHGFPANGLLWNNITDELSNSFTLIIPDLPGSGNSPLKGEMSLTGMAKMVKTIMDEEHIGKAVIAGHSMGGYIGLAFAGLYPECVAGLSLVHSTTDADDEDKKKMRTKSIDLIQNGGKKVFIEQMIPNLFSPAFKQSAPDVVKKEIERSMETPEESLVNFYKAMMMRSDSNYLLTIATYPLQWICGDDDNVIPYKKNIVKSHVSGLNFVHIYNNCGHMSMLEVPGTLAIDLKQFSTYCYQY